MNKPRSKLGLACNIDRDGKRARALGGSAALSLAAIALIVGVVRDAPIAFWIAGGLALAGAFGWFQALNGWCAVRAMGFRTRV